MTETISIDDRFRGPPTSGNGGYVCGRLAAFLDGPAAVRLRVPPPLASTLEVRRSGGGVALFQGEEVVAEARPQEMNLDPPAPPSFEAADAATRNFRGFQEHWFPSCFVCGPERVEGDGLRVFPGALADPRFVACSFVPDASLASGGNVVPPEFLWAALDCPGAYSFEVPDGKACLLGELAVSLLGNIAVGERCVLVAWQTNHEGRKHFTGTALYGESGECRGLGHATWIEVARS